MPKIAIATCTELPNLTENDQLLVPIFKEKGYSVNLEIWDNPETNWQSYDVVIIRSTWDYFLKAKEFNLWVSQFIGSKTKLINSPEIVLENSHKFYLKELQDKGISIIPTLFSSEKISIEDLKNWKKVVIKPAVSAGSHETEVFETASLTAEQMNNKVAKDDWLIQPFLSEIQEIGEISMLFFGGNFSHAIKKIPKSGDFRVQKQFGSKYLRFIPDEVLISTGKNIVEIAGKDSAYARVDGILTKNGFLLMEIEMIEPDLYFEYDQDAPLRYVKSVLELV